MDGITSVDCPLRCRPPSFPSCCAWGSPVPREQRFWRQFQAAAGRKRKSVPLVEMWWKCLLLEGIICRIQLIHCSVHAYLLNCSLNLNCRYYILKRIDIQAFHHFCSVLTKVNYLHQLPGLFMLEQRITLQPTHCFKPTYSSCYSICFLNQRSS